MPTPSPLLGFFAVVLAASTLTAQCAILSLLWDEEDQKKAGMTFAEYGSLALICGVIVTRILVFYARRSGGRNN